MFAPTLILGDSGTGKTYSLRNLNPKTTTVLNIERKPFPFKSSFDATSNILIADIPTFDRELSKAIKNKAIETLVIESFSKYIEKLLDFARAFNKGYDIYNYYNDKIGKFLEHLKDATDKQIFVLGIPERLDNINPNGTITNVRRCKVGGKAWEGLIEKEFTVVLYTEVIKPDKTKPSQYKFIVNNDGTFSAKSPPDLFNSLYIENDLAEVRKNITEFYKNTPDSSNKTTETILV